MVFGPEISGFNNNAMPTDLEGEFPHEEIPITEIDPDVNDDPKVTWMDVVPCPETNVVFDGSVHWYEEQPEID